MKKSMEGPVSRMPQCFKICGILNGHMNNVGHVGRPDVGKMTFLTHLLEAGIERCRGELSVLCNEIRGSSIMSEDYEVVRSYPDTHSLASLLRDVIA